MFAPKCARRNSTVFTKLRRAATRCKSSQRAAKGKNLFSYSIQYIQVFLKSIGFYRPKRTFLWLIFFSWEILLQIKVEPMNKTNSFSYFSFRANRNKTEIVSFYNWPLGLKRKLVISNEFTGNRNVFSRSFGATTTTTKIYIQIVYFSTIQ